jgi:long-chain acyl-CoA synthetase
MLRPWLRHYDYWVPPSLTYPQRPLCEILDTSAIDVADRPATAFLGSELTFREIKTQSDAFAAALLGLGVSKGDRVGIMLPNCPQYIVAAFAVLRLGAVVVNVNPTYTAREVLTLATDSGMSAMVTLDVLAPLVLEIRSKTRIAHVVVTSLAEYSAARSAPPRVDATSNLADLIAEARQTPAGRVAPRIAVSPDDLAVLQYTGGTTGTPKGAMLTHRNIFANVVQSERVHYRAYIRGEARYLIVIPYFHIYAFTVGMMQGIWVGALQILIPKYDVEQVLTAIKTYRPTYFPAVPTIFVSLLSHPKVLEYGLDQVRTCNSGGAPCPVDVIEEFERRIGRTLNEGYGLSETSPVTHSTPQLARRKPGTVGLPLPDTDIKVVDVETGQHELAFGEAGELCIAGPSRGDRAGAPDGRRWPRLVSYRRHRAHRRGRLHFDRPTQEGSDYRGRFQRVSIGSRNGALRAPSDQTRGRDRRAAQVPRRGRQGLRGVPRGHERHGFRTRSALRGKSRRIQTPEAHRDPPGAPHERGRQGALSCAA